MNKVIYSSHFSIFVLLQFQIKSIQVFNHGEAFIVK